MEETIDHQEVGVSTFKMWDYPVFSIALGYVWIELVNPLVGVTLQIIPRVPNSAGLLILAILLIPTFIKNIELPFKPVLWALPFLVLATINLAFIRLAQSQSFIELVSAWFWIPLLIPLQIRVLSTISGRWHFILFSTIGVGLYSLIYYSEVLASQNTVSGLSLNYHNLAPGAILLIPILVSYLFKQEKKKKYFSIASLILIAAAVIPAGARAMWLIIPLELTLLIIFVLPKGKLVVTSLILTIFFSLILASFNIERFYSEEALGHLETRLRKTSEWQEDNTIWARLGIYKKTGMILKDRPLLGVGYSNRSFSSFNAGEVEVFGQLVRVGRIDAHNTYLNILGGTGILGFMSLLYFLANVFKVFRRLSLDILRDIDLGPILISVIGMLIWYFINTHPFPHVVSTSAIVLAIYTFIYHVEHIEPEEQEHVG